MQLGLVSVSFRDHSPQEIINAVREAGLTCIEWGSDVHAPCTDKNCLKKIAAMQKTANITCCSYGTYYYLGRDNPEELHQYIWAAKYLGTNILRLWCGTKGSKDYSAEELEVLYRDCRSAAKIAEENGVILCMECHNGTVTDTKESAYRLMQTVNSPAFRMYWQPNQLRTPEENLAYAKLLAPYTYHVHVFNWSIQENGSLLKHPLLDAVDIWKGYVKQLSGEHVMLLEFMPDNNILSLPCESDALRAIMKRGDE